jgi:type I restriction enzyme S subunit
MKHSLEVPKGWELTPLGDLAEVVSGVTKGRKLPASGTMDVPYLRVANVQDGYLQLDELKSIPATVAEIEKFRLLPGDVLMTEGGDPDKLERGAVWSGDVDPCIHQNHVFRVRTDSNRLTSRYLSAFLGSPIAKIYFLRAAKQTTGIATINKTQLREFPVLLPPLPEQRRIAAILDKADAIRRKRQETIRLTEEFVRSAFLDMFGDPVTNPKGWPTVRLGEVADLVGGGTSSRSVPAYFDGPICWATSKDMKGEVLTDTQEHITEEAVNNSATKQVPKGTLLVAVNSKILMHRLPVLMTAVPACFSQDIKGILLRAGFPPRYVARHLRVGQRALLDLARGVNTEGLTLDHLREYRLMAPKQSMLARFEEVEALQEAASQKLERSLAAADDLFGAVTARAFAGAL